MKRHLLLLIGVLLAFGSIFGATQVTVSATPYSQNVQDPKTKVGFYVDSNRRHVSAFSPDGKLLWQTKPASWDKKDGDIYIIGIRFCLPIEKKHSDDFIQVAVKFLDDGGAYGSINKKTGVFELARVY